MVMDTAPTTSLDSKLKCIDDERMPSESDTHWELRRAFLHKFKDDFSEDRLRSLSMIFCNVTFLNCSYSAAMMKKVEEFSEHLQKEIQIAKGFKLARKTFSLPSLDSDDESSSFDITTVLSTVNDKDTRTPKSKKKETHGNIQLTNKFSSLEVSKKPSVKKLPNSTSTTIAPGLFKISVLKEPTQTAANSDKAAANKKKRNNKKKNANKQQDAEKKECVSGVSTSSNGKTRNKNSAVVKESDSNETIKSTTTEDVFLNISNKANQQQQTPKENSKKAKKNFGGNKNSMNAENNGNNDEGGKMVDKCHQNNNPA